MGRAFAEGKIALGICDRCGLTYELKQLKEEWNNDSPTGLLTCPECFDEDHPQNKLWRVRTDDPQSLRDARIDLGQEASTHFSRWNPVLGMTARCLVGRVNVGA